MKNYQTTATMKKNEQLDNAVERAVGKLLSRTLILILVLFVVFLFLAQFTFYAYEVHLIKNFLAVLGLIFGIVYLFWKK